jgi:hypothetical protein
MHGKWHCVYELVSSRNPLKSKYIGKTTGHKLAKKRFRAHKGAARRGVQAPVYSWMRSEVDAGYSIIFRVLVTGLSKAEAFLIESSLITELSELTDVVWNGKRKDSESAGFYPGKTTSWVKVPNWVKVPTPIGPNGL